MKVVFLSATGQVGGAERVLLDLLASLRASRPEWALHLVTGGPGPLAGEAAALGAAVHPLPLPAALARLGDAGATGPLAPALLRASPAVLAWVRRLRALLRGIGPEVVHTHGFKVHVLGALALPPGARLVWHVHDFVRTRRVAAGMMRRLARRCSAAVAVSDPVAADVRALCPRLRVHTVRNAVDLGRFRPDGPRLALHERAGMPPEAPGTVAVGLVATMGLWKGHEVFLRAVAALPRGAPVRAYVVGGRIYGTAGSEVDPAALRRLADGLGIAERVGFTGLVDDAAAAMRALDVVVHASTQPEPFGLVIAEGMACGRAVIVSAAGGAAEIASDGVDALCVPPGDVDALSRAIARLAGDAELRARLGAAARARAERDFDRARLAAEIEPIYRAIAAGR